MKSRVKLCDYLAACTTKIPGAQNGVENNVLLTVYYVVRLRKINLVLMRLGD